MLRSKTRWQQEQIDQDQIERLVAELDLHPIIARLVVQRGLAEQEEVKRFLSPSLTQLYDPFLLDGMATAVKRIRQAIEKKEKILIYGDYDADGVSSTSLLMKLFRSYEANVDYYIPNRFREGYGLNKEALQSAAKQGVQLIITVDTGISAVEEVKFANQLGLEIIITDHHEPPEEIPQALAVINPKKPNCPYPFKMLAGVGIAFKLATALLGRIPEEWLDLVALGTIADLVPLVDENRVIASFGLKRLNERKNIGLQALLEVSGIDGDVSAGHVGFSLGPRVNASGRLASAKAAVELLLTDEFAQAKSLAVQLDQMNRERQQLVERITQFALEQVEADPEKHQHVIVVAGHGWNSGVIGIVASRLVEKFYRPVIVFGIDPDTQMATGSARSIEGFHLHQALTACEEMLLKYGGHSMAAGMSISPEKISLFHQKIASLAQEWLTEEDYIPLTKVDGELKISEINVQFIEKLKVLEPYGIGNPTPHFVIRDTRIAQMKRMGVDRNHLRLQLTGDDHSIDAVAFRQAELAEEITERARVNILGQLQINEWNGRRSPQIILRDLAIPHIQIFDWRSNREKWNQIEKLKDTPCLFFCHQRTGSFAGLNTLLWSEVGTPHWTSLLKEVRYLAFVDPPYSMEMLRQVLEQTKRIERLYFLYGDTDFEDLLVKIPQRDDFKRLYQLLLRSSAIHLAKHLPILSEKLGLSKRTVSFMISVFEELDFIRKQRGNIILNKSPVKRPLHQSRLYQQQLAKEEVFQKLIYSSYRELCDHLFALIQVNWQNGGTEDGFQKTHQGYS